MEQRLRKMLKAGKSTREIATELGLSQFAARYHLKKYHLTPVGVNGRPKMNGVRSSDTNKAFLGMSYGTAMHRLRKILLFTHLKESRNNNLVCWDCKEPLETVEELSIQHKEPWLHEDVKLFWDLDNIDFSHRKCNKTNRNYNKNKTRCIKGHVYSDNNTIFSKTGKRGCKLCRASGYKADYVVKPELLKPRTKGEFLGVPYGTACFRLKQRLLFHYVAKSRESKILNCWDCGEEIKEVTDFTVQHKKPWLHESKDLFWDVNNIDFSHKKCNKTNRNRNAEKTHCMRGHEFTPDNTRYHTTKGCRMCRLCNTYAARKEREHVRKSRNGKKVGPAKAAS